jgi:hypothetical protein
MADDLTQRGGQDRTRIDVGQEHELRDWSKKFGVAAAARNRRAASAERTCGPAAPAAPDAVGTSSAAHQ